MDNDADHDNAGPATAAVAPRERWSVSPYNHAGTDVATTDVPKISDCTLRDGEQHAGIAFTCDDKVELAQAIAALGVDELEVGTPAVSDSDRLAVEKIADLGLRPRLSALARATKADVDLVKSCGVDGVRISFPASARQRRAKLPISDAEYLKAAIEISVYAKEQGLEVIFSPYDTTRADLGLVIRLVTAFAEEGCVDRIRIVDTAGAAAPEAIAYLVRIIRSVGGIPVEIHCHNDFGLATANTIAAARAGAEHLSVTVNGIGERGGNAALEEVVMALELLYGVPLRIETDRLMAVSQEVARRSGVPLQQHKAVVGGNAFTHESGMVVAALLKDPFTAEPYDPALVGRTRQIALGKLSGRASVEHWLTERGYPADDAPAVDDILRGVKDKALELGRGIEPAEFDALVQGIAARTPADHA